MILESPELLKYSGEDACMVFPHGIQVYFYDSIEELSSEIKSDYAIRYEKKQIMEVRKNVVITDHKKGKELSTEVLFWDQAQKIIYNNAFVTIKENGRIMHGDSMRAHCGIRGH